MHLWPPPTESRPTLHHPCRPRPAGLVAIRRQGWLTSASRPWPGGARTFASWNGSNVGNGRRAAASSVGPRISAVPRTKCVDVQFDANERSLGYDRLTATPARRLRELLSGPDLVRAPGAHDGITAGLIEQAGFPAVDMTGAATSAAHGYPDYRILTLMEMANQAGVIARAVSVPVISDAETGYGNELNVTRTVSLRLGAWRPSTSRIRFHRSGAVTWTARTSSPRLNSSPRYPPPPAGRGPRAPQGAAGREQGGCWRRPRLHRP